MRATLRDTELYFDIEGLGLVPDGPQMREKPVAFLVHGGPGADHSGYKPAFSPLSHPMQLVYFDHRGQGRSARGPKETYTLDNNVADMEALRQYLGLDQIVVIGGSYGGMVAMAYASRYPAHVSHLVVMVSAAHSGFLQRAQAILAARGTVEQQAIAQYLWQGNFESEAHLQEYFRLMRPLYSITDHPAQANTAPDRTILSVDAINVAFGGFLRTYDIRPELANITAPTLVLAGRHDWICPPEFSEEIARLIPRAALRILEHSGHLIRADQPEAMLAAIAEFMGYSADSSSGQP
jgi:proline iminopeptidase